MLYHGAYLPLHGTEVIVEAARMTQDLPIQWDFLGWGAYKASTEAKAKGLKNVRFLEKVPYVKVPEVICAHDIVLGVFGTTAKAARVIGNKVYECMACARPTINEFCTGYPPSAKECKAIKFIPPGDPAALVKAVEEYRADWANKEMYFREARAFFDRELSMKVVTAQLADILVLHGSKERKLKMSKKRDQLRPIKLIRNFTKHAAGSVLIKWGDTWVLCTASVEEKVPPFLKGTGKGWVTAEYSMLPSSTGGGRKDRDIKKLKQDARSTEIQRLVGRSLRAAVDMSKLGERQITIDCDVLQADGGTRCASITGGMVALEDAVRKLLAAGVITENPIVHRIAAVSVGVCDGKPTLDLDYAHDSTAEVDLNVVMTDDGRYVELQGTAEHKPFTEESLDALRALARKGLKRIFALTR